MLDCPERFFEDKEQGECLRCHPDCALCDGPNDNDCDECTDPEFTLHSGACLPTCPPHTYRDAVTGECHGKITLPSLNLSKTTQAPKPYCVFIIWFIFNFICRIDASQCDKVKDAPETLCSPVSCNTLSCKMPLMHFLNYTPLLCLSVSPDFGSAKIETLFRRLTGSCQTLKNSAAMPKMLPWRKTLRSSFCFSKNTKDAVFLRGRCCRRCPLLLLHTVAAGSQTVIKELQWCTAKWTGGISVCVFPPLSWTQAAEMFSHHFRRTKGWTIRETVAPQRK